jgi:hypothetical protein
VSGINRQPYGLLSFFGIKNSGRNPEALAGTIAPTLDLSRWYLEQNSQSSATNQAVAAVGFTSVLTVPDFQTWCILGVSVNSQAVLGAGVTLCIGGAWSRNPASNVVRPLTTFPERDFTTGQVAVAWSEGNLCTFAPAGSQVGIYCSRIVAGPVTCTLNLTFVPMDL